MRTPTAPAMPNAHSHAFQRRLRGTAERTRGGGDDFWSWREAMYDLARRIDPDRLRGEAEAAFAEMRAAGYGAVGEFHYVHHQPDGTPYDDPNELAHAVVEAARAAGIRLVLLPAAYHRAGWDGGDLPPANGQERFSDPDVDVFLARVDALRISLADEAGVSVGVAAHSVRAVPAAWLREIAAYADEHGLVRHVHAHEQPRELEECRAEHGLRPIELLAETGFLGPRTSVVHGIHVSASDVALLAEHGATVVTCPTTEGNLGDGIFPERLYREAGVPYAIGSDSQVRIDPFEEVRELETLSRRQSGSRVGPLAATGDLWGALAAAGCAGLGLDEPGELALDPAAPELDGVPEEDVPLALATCASARVVARPADDPWKEVASEATSKGGGG
jgi:formimidoylglutamate deiminase